jgi:hypothetical protein
MTPINAQKQQELFEEFVIREKRKGKLFGAFKFKKPIFPQQRLTLSFSYEILIIMLIGVVLAASILFSLGVERGRGMELSADVSSSPVVQPVTVIPPVDTVAEQAAEIQKQAAARPVKKQEPVKAVVPPVPAEDKPFTIQVASYKTRDLAEKELTRLKKKGYSSDILKKGNYFILCVGSYAKKELANQALPYWEQQYKGCIVRKR